MTSDLFQEQTYCLQLVAAEGIKQGMAIVQKDLNEALAVLQEYHDAAEENEEACRRIIDGSGPLDHPARLRWIAAGKTARALLAKPRPKVAA